MGAREDWKLLKPQIGKFVNTLDGLYKGAENIDEAINKAEERGYKKGFSEGIVQSCQDCDKNDWFRDCNGHYCSIRRYLELSSESQQLVDRMISALHKEVSQNAAN